MLKEKLIHLNKVLYELDHEYNKQWWNYSTIGSPLATEDINEKKKKIFDDETTFDQLKTEIYKQNNDELNLRRAILFLRQFYINRVNLDDNIQALIHEITENELTFDATINGKTYTINEIRLLSKDFTNHKLQNEAIKRLEILNERKKRKFLEIIKLRNELSRILGFRNYSEIFFFGITPGLEGFLDLINNTVNDYVKIAKEWEVWIRNISGEQSLNKGASNIQVELDQYYKMLNPQDTMFDLLKSWELVESFQNIRIFSANDHPRKKHWWTFCQPVSIPDDIRISINTINSFEYLETYYHEMGHAIHYASIDQSEWIFKVEDLMTEISASIFTNICMENEWIERNLKIKNESLIEKIKKVNITRNPVTILSRCIDFLFMLNLYTNETTTPETVFDDLYNSIFCYRDHQLSTIKPGCIFELYYADDPFYGLFHLVGEIMGKKSIECILQHYESIYSKEVGNMLVKELFSPGNSIDWLKRINKLLFL